MKQSTFFSTIHLFLGMYIVLWLNAGNFSYIGDYIPTVVKFGLVAIWLMLSFVQHPDFIVEYVKLSWPLLFFTFIMIVSMSSFTQQFQMNYIYCLIMLAVTCYYYKYGTPKDIKAIILIFALDVLIVSIHTYVVVLENPIVARAISTGAALREDLLEDVVVPKGVGGYGLCYQLCCLIPIVSYFFNKKKINIIVKLIAYAFVLLLLFQAQFTLALITYVICLIISFSYGKNGTINLLIAKFVMVVVAVLLIINIEPILEYAIELSNAELATRLNEILNFIRESDTSGSDISSRLDLYQKSLNSFGSNIIIGSFGAKTYGSHSTFLDLLGAFGIIGGLGYAGLVLPMFKARNYIQRDNNIRKVATLSILVIMVLSVINVIISVEIMLTSIVILPLGLKYLYDNGGGKLENSAN
ncbi:MAG: hypothetical protein J6D23_04950 [Clostridia bacterium]|nr:hypothetical protein [Clostridia bacterium]